METRDYLNYVVHEIHRTIVEAVDEEGLHQTGKHSEGTDDICYDVLAAKAKKSY